MRNIIFTSLAVALASMAAAQEGPAPGCYAREYSQAHLDKYPDQVVRALHIWVQDQTFDDFTSRYAWLVADFANQGHVRREGHGAQRLTQGLSCFESSDGRKGCAVDCDGGAFYVTREGGGKMTIATTGLWVGDAEECGGAIDLAEVSGQEVKYLLHRVEEAACLALVEN